MLQAELTDKELGVIFLVLCNLSDETLTEVIEKTATEITLSADAIAHTIAAAMDKWTAAKRLHS